MFHHLEINERHSESINGLKRITIFPETFPKPSFGTVHKEKFIELDDRTRATLKRHNGGITIYDLDRKYEYLKPSDVIGVEKTEDKDGNKTLLKITNCRMAMGDELLESYIDNPALRQEIESQIGRELKPGDKIHIIEAILIYDWQIEQDRPVI